MVIRYLLGSHKKIVLHFLGISLFLAIELLPEFGFDHETQKLAWPFNY